MAEDTNAGASRLIVATSDGSLDAVFRANGQEDVADRLKAEAEKSTQAGDNKTDGASEGGAEHAAVTEDEASEVDAEAGKVGAAPRPARGFKAKLERTRAELELTARERDQARREAEDAARRLKELEASEASPSRGSESAPAGSAQASADDLVPPDFADFATEAEYRVALAKHNQRLVDVAVAKAMKQRDEQEALARMQAGISAAQQRLAASSAEARKTHADFDQVVLEAHRHLERRGMELSEAVEQCILTSDAGGELLYALAENPQELARLCALRPLDAAREVGRYEERVKATRSTSDRGAPSLRSAPSAPLSPPRGGSAGVDDDPSKWDQAKYEEKRKAGWGRAR